MKGWCFDYGILFWSSLRLEEEAGVPIMSGCGFTIHNELNALGIKLNIPPFMEGRK